jgi:PAS domain S-box-containing protein
MNLSSIIGLVNNAALLLALCLIYDMLGDRPQVKKSSVQQILTGVAIGAIGIAIMLNPWEFMSGVVFDTRSVLLSISGLFLGAVPTLLAVLITGCYRLYLSGTGAWTGVAVIATSGGVGLAWRHLRHNKESGITPRELYLLGITVHIAMLLWMFSLPWPVAKGVLSKISLPVLLIFPVTTALLGWLMTNRESRKRAEEDLCKSGLTDIIKFLPYATLAIDKEKRIIIWNKAIEKMTGVPAAEMIGKGDYAYTIPFYGEARPQLMDLILMDQGDVAARYPNVVREDDSLTVEVFCNALYNNKGAWVFAKASPLHDHSGNIIGAIESICDITERKRAEEEKAKLEGQIQRAQKMESIGSLAGGIAHDLNNILFPISGLSEMLLDDMPPDTPEYKSIEQIHKSAKRGSDLVKQILSFSRQSNPQKLPIRIQPILKEALKLAQATIPRNIEVKSHINTDCGMVSADPTQIHQIAMNLITNAFHAVEQTGGMIDIALKETAICPFGEKDELSLNAIPGDILAGGYACITVSDTGTGIDQTLIDKIFDPYFTTKELGKGTGLGLSVVHGIVKEHGGDIRVYSEVGKGTAFHVYLPLLEDNGDIKTAAVIKQYPTGHERILLVDDEEPILRMEQMMLERLGYQVTTRMSSPDALAAFKANPGNFDLVISDRGMPNMTGDQLAGELISIRPEIPVIICSGFCDENNEKRSMDLGIKGFLKKPVTTGDLAEMVRKVLDEVAGGA